MLFGGDTFVGSPNFSICVLKLPVNVAKNSSMNVREMPLTYLCYWSLKHVNAPGIKSNSAVQ